MSSSSSERPNKEKKKHPLPVIDLGELLGDNFRCPNSSVSNGGSHPMRPSISETSTNRLGERKTETKRDETKSKGMGSYSEKQASDERDVAKVSPSNAMEKLEGRTDGKTPNPEAATRSETKVAPMCSQRQELLLRDEMTMAGWRSRVTGQEEHVSDTKHAASDNAGAAMSTVKATGDMPKSSSARNLSNAEGDPPSQARAGAVATLNEEPESQNAESPTVATKRQRSSGLQAATTIDDIMVSTLNRCVPLPLLPLSEYSISLADAHKIELPEFQSFANFPQYCRIKADKAGKRNCVLCGNLRSCFKKRKDSNGVTPFIPTKSKGVCTSCEVAVWNMVGSNVQIKFCQQCIRFRPLAFFTAKETRKQEGRFLGSCTHCRNRISELKRKGSGFESDGSKETQDASAPDEKKQKTETSEE